MRALPGRDRELLGRQALVGERRAAALLRRSVVQARRTFGARREQETEVRERARRQALEADQRGGRRGDVLAPAVVAAQQAAAQLHHALAAALDRNREADAAPDLRGRGEEHAATDARDVGQEARAGAETDAPRHVGAVREARRAALLVPTEQDLSEQQAQRFPMHRPANHVAEAAAQQRGGDGGRFGFRDGDARHAAPQHAGGQRLERDLRSGDEQEPRLFPRLERA